MTTPDIAGKFLDAEEEGEEEGEEEFFPTPIVAHPSNALAVISNICHGSSATARTLADGARSSLAAHVQASAQAVLKGVRPLVP